MIEIIRSMGAFFNCKSNFLIMFIFFPLILRLFTICKFKKLMNSTIKESTLDVETYRGYIYSFIAITVAVLLALIISDSQGIIKLKLSVFFALISFGGFFIALSMQSYKFFIYHVQIIDGLIDNSQFTLFLTIASVVYSVNGFSGYSITIYIILFMVYFHYLFYRTFYNVKYLKGKL